MGFNILAIVVALSLVHACLGQYSTLYYDGLYATITGTAPNYVLVLLPPLINSTTQQWNFSSDKYIVSVYDPRYVFDVTDSSTNSWTRVGLFLKKPAPAPNQQWNVYSNGTIESHLHPGFCIVPTTVSFVLVVDYQLVYGHVEPVVNQSWYCESSGDPHYYPFPGGRPDIWSLQVQGDYILAIFGNTTVYTHQTVCAPGFYCNDQVAFVVNGYTILIRGDNVTIDGVPVVISGTLVLWYGVSVLRTGVGWYEVIVPGGSISMHSVPFNNYNMENVYITLTSGPEPTGGLCTGYIGPNAPSYRWCNRSVPYTPLQFANSWKVRSFCDNPFGYASEDDWRAANPISFNTSKSNVSTTDPVLYNNALALCLPLLQGYLISNCSQHVVPTTYYQSCLDDVIASTVLQWAAPIINAYATRCGKTALGSVVLPTSGNRCNASGPGLGNVLQPGVSTSFTIFARDVLGNPVTHGGDNFVVTATGPATLSFTITDLKNGTYLVTYTPSVTGTFVIYILLNGVDAILNSPYTAVVPADQTTDPTQSIAYGQGLLSPIQSYNKYLFTVQAKTHGATNRTAGGDTLAIAISGTAYFSTQDNENGSYTVLYQQQKVGTFDVYILLNDVQIKGSPFVLSCPS